MMTYRINVFRHFYQYLLLVVFIGLPITAVAQANDQILESFDDYATTAREVIYLHLNKSTFIKGEAIGFTAYVLDKKNKRPSLLTSNLYVSIENSNQTPIVQQLIKVENGVASNAIELDDNFSTGSYIIKAYTNWSRNFQESNFFSSSFEVMDPATDAYVNTEHIETAIDAQFLPESGHLLANIPNKVGVVLKDTKGFGLGNATGKVLGQKGELLTTFKINSLGIGQFLLKPSPGAKYKVVITHNYKDFEFGLNQTIEPIGLTLSTSQSNNRLFVNVNTNSQSLKYFKGQRLALSFHNGAEMQIENLSFDETTTVSRAFDTRQLPPGITVFTLFNDDQKPIAERLYFNYEGLDILNSSNVQTAQIANDSIAIDLAFQGLASKSFHNISVSVLPEATKSYAHHHNLISYNYLQPYVKGPIENARYYFTDVNEQKAADLDMLLLTQGWSSYNWTKIFNTSNSLPYDFEQGISIKANINNNSSEPSTYMVHAIKDKAPVFFELDEDQKTFQLDYTFVTEEDPIALSVIDKNEALRPAQLYLQTSPSYIPKLSLKTNPLVTNANYQNKVSFNDNTMTTQSLDDVQSLDEVVITTELEKNRTRLRELNKTSYGLVGIVTETETLSYLYLEDYLINKFRLGLGIRANGDAVLLNPRGGSPNSTRGITPVKGFMGAPMQIFLDGIPLNDFEILRQIPLYQIDYVDVNYSGLGEGARGNNGAIRIYQSNKSSFNSINTKTSQVFEVPLTFTSEKTYYTPLYRYRSDDFYKEYGTIGWFPKLQLNQYGKTRIQIQKPLVPITLFIEGIDSDGKLIYEEKTLLLN